MNTMNKKLISHLLHVGGGSAKCLSRHFSKQWLQRHVNDAHVKQATKENLRSRSAFKLKEIQDKHNIIRPNDFVLDIGAAPGGWSLIASGILRPQLGGLLIAIDLLSMDAIPNCEIIQGDIRHEETKAKIEILSEGRKADVVISDMLANTCGNHMTDHFRSMDLCNIALEVALEHLKVGGSFLCKYLRGSDEAELINAAKNVFNETKIVKPKASRSESTEIYLLCKTKR